MKREAMKTIGKPAGKSASVKPGRAKKKHRSGSRTNEERLQSIFDTIPVSIWEEDFSKVKHAIDDLSAQGVTDFRTYLAEHPEFAKNAARMVKVIDVTAVTLKLFEAKS